MKMITKYFTFLIVLLAYCATLFAQEFEWANSMGGNQYDHGFNVTTDGNGNAYVVGSFANTSYFGSGTDTGTLISTGETDAFIAKYDASGKYVWSKRMGGTGFDQGMGGAVDDKGNVYVTGYFANTSYFGSMGNTDTLISTGAYDVFLAKYDSSGNYLWAKKMGGRGTDYRDGVDYALDVAVDGNGNAFVTGFFAVNCIFGEGSNMDTLTSVGQRDIFVAKYDANGNYVWAKSIGGTRNDVGAGIAIDYNGSIFVTGYIAAQGAYFGEGANADTLIPVGGENAFVARYDSNGNYVWAKSVGGGGSRGFGIAVDSRNNVYFTGTFPPTGAYFGEGSNMDTLSSIGGSIDAFIAKYDTDGNYLWAEAIGGIDTDQGWAVAVDRSSNVYVTGCFSAQGAYFGEGSNIDTFASVGQQDIFVAKYDSEGNYKWATSMGGPGVDLGTGIAVDGSGNMFVTGGFGGVIWSGATAYFGLDTLFSIGHYDVFLAKFACNDTTSSFLKMTRKCGDSLLLNGEVYTREGIYTQIFSNTLGCDSTLVIELQHYEIEPFISVNEKTLSVTESYATYQWIKDGQDIPGATNSTFNVLENGDYRVRVTNEQDCEGTSEAYTVNNATNITSTQVQKIRVFPNPVEDVVFVESAEPVIITVVTVEGRELSTSNLAVSHQISVKDWVSGVYYINLFNQEGKILKIEKIIKR